MIKDDCVLSERHSQQLCCEVVSVITALSHKHHDQLSVFSALVKHWHCFAGKLEEVIEMVESITWLCIRVDYRVHGVSLSPTDEGMSKAVVFSPCLH